MGVGYQPQTIETEPGYGQLFSVLLRRRNWLIGTFVSVVSAAAVATLLMKPAYQSYMQLLVEPNYQGKRGQTQNDLSFADSNVEVDYSTQLTLMRSSQLLEKALNSLKNEYPDLEVAEVQKNLLLLQVEDAKVKTKVFQVVYRSDDSEKTQRVLQAIQKVYQDYNREQQKQRLSKGLAFVDEQLPQVQKQVAQSESNLERFRKSQNLVDPELQAKALIDALSLVRDEQRKNDAQIREAAARYAELQQQLARSPANAITTNRLSQSARYQTLLNEIQKTELFLTQTRTRYTDESPVVKKIIERLNDQRAMLKQEAERVLGSVSPQLATGRLQKEGQLGDTDQALTTQLVEARVALQALQARQQSLQRSEQALSAEQRRFPRLLAEYGRLQPKVQVDRETLQQLLKARQELALETARGGFDWQVVEEPKLGAQVSPSWKKNLLLGVFGGLVLGCFAAFAREAFDDAVHSSDELKKQVSLPLLGMTPAVPEIAMNKAQPRLPETAQVVQWQPFREAMDLIYKNLQLLNPDFPLRSLVLTSALAGEGKSTLAVGLAMSAARLHQRVLLIDADLRRPNLHRQLNLPNERGLSTLLASDTPIEDADDIPLSATYNNISILTAGPTPTDPAKLLSSRRMGELMTAFEQTYDLVLLDAPPVLGIVDTILTASFCGGVLLVGRIGRVTRTELTQATTTLSKLNVIGVIANGSSDSVISYSSYEKRSNKLAVP
ncbi:MAG: polysaccharide biosynthesis tyrosine autokinase [Oscillatoriales cyanobacterium C42_A2020_001]|nr:polysaccharide biosynthesis tyrosine autokinase [Leptolyngbyaceae cyanobacterium C42_A2020_001]